MSEKIPVKLCFKKIEKLQREKFYGTLEAGFRIRKMKWKGNI